jgi:hypothetical protein
MIMRLKGQGFLDRITGKVTSEIVSAIRRKVSRRQESAGLASEIRFGTKAGLLAKWGAFRSGLGQPKKIVRQFGHGAIRP